MTLRFGITSVHGLAPASGKTPSALVIQLTKRLVTDDRDPPLDALDHNIDLARH